jgi:hypothetical protein
MKILFINSPRYDFLTSSLLEGLIENGHQVYCTESSNSVKSNSDIQCLKIAENADLIVVVSGRLTKRYLLSNINHDKIVCIDGTDSQKLFYPKDISFNILFKREISKYFQNDTNRLVYPLPFAAEKRYFLPMVQKDILLSCLLNMTNPLRSTVQNILRTFKDSRLQIGNTAERSYHSGVSNPVKTPSFSSILSRSLASINVAGAGYDCARHWEILSAGSVLFTQELDIDLIHPFIDGKDCITFSSFAELIEKTSMILDGCYELENIALNGMNHLLKYHTTSARAFYFIQKIFDSNVSSKHDTYKSSIPIQTRLDYLKDITLYKLDNKIRSHFA